MDMKVRVSSSRLKARLGRYMRSVRAGGEIEVTDRDQPVARLVPWSERPDAGPGGPPAEQARDPGAPPLGEIDVKPIRYRGRSTTALLEEDRRRR